MTLIKDVKSIINKHKEYIDELDLDSKEDIVHISYISLKRKFRGKGIGTFLLRELIQAVKINNCELTLTVASANTRLYNRLIKFYTSVGLNKKTNEEGFIYFTTKK